LQADKALQRRFAFAHEFGRSPAVPGTHAPDEREKRLLIHD
jgi:hypothetical protein